MSGGLTEDQVQTVRDDLSSATSLRVFPIVVETVLFAIFTLVICVSNRVLISKGLCNLRNRILLALTLVMYSVSATLWAIDLKLMWNELKVILPGLLSSNIPVDTLGEMNHDLFFATDMISLVNFVFSDAVVLWRACVVWNLRKAVVCLAVCIFTCLIGCGILFVLSDIRLYFGSAAQSRVSVSNTTGNIILPILISLSLFINVWATSMVALRAWIHRRDIRRYLQSRTERSAVESGFMMLVESGIVYSIGMVLLMFAFIPSTSSGVFFTYWGRSVMNQVSGMYPTLVIVLVALQKSHRDHQFSFLDKGPDGTLPFSVRVPPSQSSARISAPGMHPSLQLGTAQGPSREDARVDPLDEAFISPREKEHADA